MNSKLCQSYVSYEDKEYFVSTINREGSAMQGGVYAETMVWEWDRETRNRGNLVGQDEGMKDTIRVHIKMVERIFATGTFEDGED